MSKTPLISLNDGTSWADAVPKLRTDELGASSTDWVQEDDTKAASLKVTANGTYAAASAGKYGYDYVTVSVKGGSATGIGPDGNEHTVTPDPETGKLIDEVIPSSIVVTTKPTTFIYTAGDTIDFTGIVVTAYTLDGEVWEDSSHPGGVIPVSELEFPVTVAVYDPDAPQFVATISTDLNVFPLAAEFGYTFGSAFGIENSTLQKYQLSKSCSIATGEAKLTGGDMFIVVAASDEEFTVTDAQGTSSNAKTITKDNKTAYYSAWFGSKVESDVLYPPPINGLQGWTDNPNVGNIAWAMIYNDISDTSGGVSIPVNWERPGDGAVLEDTFPINVTPAST